jgi:hypothetical protein
MTFGNINNEFGKDEHEYERGFLGSMQSCRAAQ